MVRFFCDRCDANVNHGEDLTIVTLPAGVTSTVQQEAALCRGCCEALRQWSKPLPKVAEARS